MTYKTSNKQIAKAISLSLKNKTETELGVIFDNIKKFLAKKHLTPRVDNIFECLEKHINEENKVLIVNTYSPSKLTQETKDYLILFIEKKYPGNEIMINENIDKTLIDGLKIKIKDEIIDLSLRNKMTQLRDYLLSK